MTKPQATAVGVSTFVVALALAVALFAALDVAPLFLLAPAAGIAASAYAAYRTALDDSP